MGRHVFGIRKHWLWNSPAFLLRSSLIEVQNLLNDLYEETVGSYLHLKLILLLLILIARSVLIQITMTEIKSYNLNLISLNATPQNA